MCDNNCIYTHKEGLCKGLRCGNDIGDNGYCDEHRIIAMNEAWPKVCLGLYREKDKWIKCQSSAVVDGYCKHCIDLPESTIQLRTRCKTRMRTGTHAGQRCYRKAEKNGHCLHCLHNHLDDILINEDMDTIIETFSYINTDETRPVKKKSWGQWMKFWRK